MRVALTCKRDVFLLGKGRQVREYFFDHRRQVNRIVARDTAQLAHLEQGLCHVRHPLGLLLQQPEQARCIGVGVGVLGAKKLNLGLHERKWRAQLVRRIARKLSLCGKSLVKAGNHVVKRRAAAPEFRGHVLADFCVGEVVGPHALDLRRKEAQRPQRMSAYKVGQHAAEQRYRRSYIPARRAKRFLGVVHDDGQRVVELFVCRVK